jgi:hypothetical protein
MSQFRFASVWRSKSTETFTELLKYQEVLELFDSQFPRYTSREIKETIITVEESSSTANEMVEYEITKIKIILSANRIVLIATKSRVIIITSFQLRTPEYSHAYITFDPLLVIIVNKLSHNSLEILSPSDLERPRRIY